MILEQIASTEHARSCKPLKSLGILNVQLFRVNFRAQLIYVQSKQLFLFSFFFVLLPFSQIITNNLSWRIKWNSLNYWFICVLCSICAKTVPHHYTLSLCAPMTNNFMAEKEKSKCGRNRATFMLHNTWWLPYFFDICVLHRARNCNCIHFALCKSLMALINRVLLNDSLPMLSAHF